MISILQAMIRRNYKNILLENLERYPAVALLGPRQVGKTTLAKEFDGLYFDLELEEEQLRLNLKWDDLVKQPSLVILDEAQSYPEIFPKIRNAVDQNRKQNGKFLILGSVSPTLMKNVSESLAGRIALCELSPFDIHELNLQLEDDLWLTGGFPDGGILNPDTFPEWQQYYLDLLAMRDLPLLGLPAKSQVTKRFYKMLAISHGQLWNASQIGKSLGVSYHTVNTYLDYLEDVYLLRRVPPFMTNLKKRLVKSPKIYFRDSGLLHGLLNVDSYDNLLSQPWVGASWEGWIIEQILIFLKNNGVAHDGPYFLRTSDGYEIDCILNIQNTHWAIEVKLSSSPGLGDLNRLVQTAELAGIKHCALISRQRKAVHSGNIISADIFGFLNRILD